MKTSHTKNNIVMIVADDLGYGDIACYGNRYVSTPHLDALATEGLTLWQHYSASPLCAPARASLLTGRYNHRTGAVDVPSNRGLDRISLCETTMADVLGSLGYATGMIGKWHNGAHDMSYHPNNRGFREFAGFLHGGMDYRRWVLDYNGSTRKADGRYLTDVFTEEAVLFIERHYKEPFFLYVAYNAPHLPLQAPQSLVEKYRAMTELTPAVQTLYAMIEAMDAGIGRILESLERSGISEQTMVLFTSDNGPMLGGTGPDCLYRYNGPWAGGKGSVLEGGIRVPAILRWPGVFTASSESDTLVHFIDWYPTMCQVAGGAPPWPGRHQPLQHGRPVDGFGMLPVLSGDSDPTPEMQKRYWQRNRYRPFGASNAAMRDGDWKLYWPVIPGSEQKLQEDAAVYIKGLTEPHAIGCVDKTLPEIPAGGTVAPRLFNLSSDPAEALDLAAADPDRVHSMTSAWQDWFGEVSSEWERVWPEL